MNDPTRRRKIIFFGSIVVLIIFRRLLNNSATPSPKQTSTHPTPTQIINPTIKPTRSPFSQTVDEHHGEAGISKYLLDQDYKSTKVSAITAVKLSELVGAIPSDWKLVTSSSRSPSGLYSLVKTESGIEITDTQSGRVVRSAPLGVNINAFNAVWLTDRLVVMAERDNSDQRISRIYIVEVNIGKKTFITGDFPSVAGFNIGIDPSVYNTGKDVIYTDNDSRIWHLNIIYKK